MLKNKIPFRVKFVAGKKCFLRSIRRMNLKRSLTSLILAFFCFNLASPTALALWETPTAKAAELQGFGGLLSSAVSTVFGSTGEILQKFDNKSEASLYRSNVKNNTQFDLVAILVDEDIAKNTQNYGGLIATHNPTVPNTPEEAYRKLTDQTLIGRIERYARDLQAVNKVKDPQPYIKTVILKVKRNQPTDEIASALEKLYREGDGTLAETNRLKGIVIVGQIPLPVVNKNGNRFVSMFPYTDFDDPYYIFDQESRDFIISSTNQKAGAEVWHGIIVPPADGEEGNNLLAEYFDKNHLFKLGETAYSDFDKKLFYSDLNKEYKLLGEEGLPSYYQYLKYWEDISYFRFNKTWAQKLFKESPIGKPEGDGLDNDGDGKIDEDPSNGYDDDGDAETGSPLFGLINRVDDDGDGEIDNDEEGVWGFCSAIPQTGAAKLQNCQAAGQPYKTGNFYNTKPGSLYKVADNLNNNPESDMRVDEGIDEDEGDAFIKIDNDRDGRIDEDTSQDNDLDLDGKVDEDLPGDMNGDGYPGERDTDEDQDSVDSDNDGWPDGYERDYGSLSLTPAQFGDLADAAANGNVKEAFAALKSPTDREDPWGFPMIILFIPPLPPLIFPRFMFPSPGPEEWIDEGSASDDDEDGKVDEDGTNDNDKDQDGSFDEDPGDALGSEGKGDGGNIFDNMSDIRTRDIIMNFFKYYNDLFDKFYADINTWTEATGRYDPGYVDEEENNLSDLVTFPFLISAKDEFTRIYLQAVNATLEKKVDQYVQKLQYDIDLVKGSTLSGYVVLSDNNGVFPPNLKIVFKNIDFINFGYENAAFFNGIEAWLDALALIPLPDLVEQAKADFLKSIAGPVSAATPIYINGKSIDSITNIAECTLYRGSEGDENSQMVIASTVYDPSANMNKEAGPQMPAEWSLYPRDVTVGTDGNDYEGLYWHWNNGPENYLDEGIFAIFPPTQHTPTAFKWLADQRLLNKAFAGCFSENANEPSRCFPYLATRYIFSLGGGKQVTGIPNNAVSHQACFDLKEKSGYDAFSLAANIYLKHIGSVRTEEEKAAFDPEKPNQLSVYQPPIMVKLLDFINSPPLQYETTPGNNELLDPNLVVNALLSPTLKTFTVDLEQVLRKYMAGNRIDDNGNGVVDDAAEANLQFFAFDQNGQPNWYQVGEQLLQKKRTDENAAEAKSKPLKFGPEIIPGTKEVYIRVTPIPGKTISSLVYHKDPTVDTVQAQTYELERDAAGNFIEDNSLTPEQIRSDGKYKVVTKTIPDPNDPNKTITVKKETRSALSIPIDSPRYVSFRDANGQYQKIVYPNAFRAKDINEFKQQLTALEQQLKAIQVNPLYGDPNTANPEGLLTNALQPFLLRNDTMNTGLDEISVVSEVKLSDSLKWKGLDIDQKHDYVLKHYWGSALSPFTPLSESSKGYEVLYLNSTGDAGQMSMKFNKDIPPAKTVDKVEEVDCSRPEYANYLACKDETGGSGSGSGSGGQSAGGSGGSAPGAGEEEASMTPVFITEWFTEIQKWASETREILNGKGATEACPAGGFADIPDSGPVETEPYKPDVILSVPVDLDGNGLPDEADKTVKLSLQYDRNAKNILKAGTGDQTKVVVTALDLQDGINTEDKNNLVKLTVRTVSGTEPVATIAGNDTVQLAGGKARFVLQPGKSAGTVALQAELVSKPTVKSDFLTLTVSSEIIKLMTYRRFNTYKFADAGKAGYSIMDGNGNPIADVDPQTGYITILNDQYEVRVLAATGVKPLRQAVTGKEDGKVYAILYFVVAGDKAVNIDDRKVDYLLDFASLPGVHVKDLSAADNLSLMTPGSEDADLKGGLIIVDANQTENAGRRGYIDKRGNAFSSLKMKVKNGSSPNSPVVFVIENTNGQPAFEMYVGARFELITELPYEQLKEFFAKLPGVLLAQKWLQRQWLQIGQAHAAETTDTTGGSAGSADGGDKTALIIPDTDKDGLNDLEELVIGTDINKADTNGDGISDSQSLIDGKDPRLAGKNLFSDLSPGQEGYKEVVKLLRRGLVIADSSGKIRPKDNITREEFIKLDLGGICVICDRFAETVKNSVWKVYAQDAFPDTDIGQEYKYCVAEGKNRGIISGYKAYENAGYYVPKANISRAEATKVILETARQQIESFPDFTVNENLTGKPWYYNYVLTAQKEGLYPQGKFAALDDKSAAKFKTFFDQEIINSASGLPGGLSNSQFMIWLSQPISRVEFAIMVSRFSDKYNCLANDQDGDGLPDNLEKYIYGTSVTDADTDKGGVKDGAEVLRGSSPLDPADDFPKPPEPDADSDEDKDGLTYAKENEIGTDPTDPDTDQGGIKDGVEYLLGTDPLDSGDDRSFGSGSGLESNTDDGAYLSGIEIGPKTIYELPTDGTINASQINTEETDRVPADGESTLYVRATLYDQDGAIRADDSVSVVNFGFKNKDDGLTSTLFPPSVRVTNGVAETVLTSKTKTGQPIIIASVDGKTIPSDEKQLDVYALPPASATLTAVSPIIPSGGKSTTELLATLKDKNNNLADSGNYTVTFQAQSDLLGEGNAILDTKQDEDKNKAGIQMSSVTGEYGVKLISGRSPENLNIKISYQDEVQTTGTDVNNSTTDLLNLGTQIIKPAAVEKTAGVETRDDLQLSINSNKTELKADNRDLAQIQVRVEDSLGNNLTGFVGEATVKLLNPEMGRLIDDQGQENTSLNKTLNQGVAKFTVRSSLKAGNLVLLANVEGLPMASLAIENYAYNPKQIVLETSSLQVDANPANTYTVKARLYDANGNFVNRNSTTQLTFSIDPESVKFGSIIGNPKVKVVNGLAEINFRTGTLTGPLRLRAKANGLQDGYLEISAVTNFQGRTFREIKPKFLYANLLGSGFGEVTSPDYLGGWFVFSGKVQSAASLITDPKPKMRLVEVTPSGKININDSNNFEIRLIPTGKDNAPVKQVVNDLTQKKEILETEIITKPQTQINLVTLPEDVEVFKETVNVLNLVPDNELYAFDNNYEKVTLTRDGQAVAEIGRDAKIKLLSPTMELAVSEQSVSADISWSLFDSGNELAQIIIHSGDLGDVQLLENNVQPTPPGIYLRLLASLPQRSLIQSFSGNSSFAPRGYYYTDDAQVLDKNMAPGLSYISLESADSEDGIGLRGDNKNVLLFAAGNTVGEANLPYASDGGVVLGDPTVRIDNRRDPSTLENLYSAAGYTRDLGKMILANNKPVQEIAPIDYDNDSDKDLLVAYQDGRLNLLENTNSGKQFIDRGTFLNFANGVLSQTVADLNNDGWDDLIVATANSCKIGEVCVDAYLNNKGNFERKNLPLQGYSARNKVYMIKSADMNRDEFPDLVVSDDTGSIKIFYSHNGEINKQGSQVGNLGVKINQTDNLKEEVFAWYTGMQGNQAGLTDDKYFEKVVLKGANSQEDKSYELKSISRDDALKSSSTKKARDLTEPFNVLAEGDRLEYTIKLVNNGSTTLNNFMVGDIVPENVSLDASSIKCQECQEISFAETGMSLRPYLIMGVDLPPNATRTITYEVTVSKLPKVKIAIGQNLSSAYPVKDSYPDIAATPENNPTGRVVYYYSNGRDNQTGIMTYGTYVTPDPNANVQPGYQPVKNPVTGKTVGLDLSLFDQKGPDGIPVAAKYLMDYGTFPGLDLQGAGGGSQVNSNGGGGGGSGEGDSVSSLPGVGGAYDSLSAGLDKAANKIEGALAALTCSAGCIPTPINFAFLAPGMINVMGIPGGFDPGLPIFGLGGPSVVPVWPDGTAYQATQYRLYLSPTLTGKVAMANCFGTYLVGFGTPVPGNCFTIVLPIDPFAGLCDAIAGAVEGALAGANSMISEGTGAINGAASSMGMSSDGSMADAPTADGKNYTGGFEAASSLGNYGFKVNAKTNVRMPGFPSVLTDWLDNQQSEIINKLTDLPDIYILLPDVLSAFKPTSTGDSEAAKAAESVTQGKQNPGKEPVSPKGLRGVLNEINKIPIIKITPQEVIIKIPSLTPGEIERFINDAKQWVEDEKAEINRVLSLWKCGPFKEMVPDPNGGTDAEGKPKMVPGYIETDADGNQNTVYGERPYNKICDMLTVDMTKLIQSVEKNIEAVEGYKQLPRQILAWRNYFTKYITQVICYIDAIVQFLVGTVSKLLTQANAWIDAVATLIETIATWKLMFDLVLDYQTSCDKCSSARFTLLELILKLFAFIPSPPIIPFPKLPDIYLDFSQIQMGIEVIWPDIKFRPEKIVLPRLPRIVFPELPTFQITLPEIPVLPDLSFNLPELPDLPPLILPAIPNLPPPPKIPVLPGAIKATVSILKKIFKILCLIKKGFIPTSEMSLKSTIEHMTERGLEPLLPIDLGLALQLPSISYNYIERIVLTVKVNLKMDVAVIYDIVKSVADKLNVIATNFAAAANTVSKGLETAAAAAAEKVNAGMDNAMPDGNSGDNPLLNYLSPAGSYGQVAGQGGETGLAAELSLSKEFSALSPQLAEAVGGLITVSRQLADEAAQYQQLIDDGTYRDVQLIATATVISPDDPSLNKSIGELEQFDYGRVMLALGDGFQETKKLASLRQNLLAYAKDNQKINEQSLAGNDLSKFAVLMADALSLSDLLVKSGYREGTMVAGEKKLYAAVPTSDDLMQNSGIPASAQSKPVAKGMFVYNEAQKINEKILAYEEELSQPVSMNFVDVNNDTDNDLVYSLGGNVYLKENYSKSGNIGYFYGGLPKYHDLEEFIPAEISISGLTASFTGNRTLDIKWNPAGGEDLTGYELIVGKMLGGVAYKGVINDLKAAGLSKYVFLNSLASTGATLTDSLLQPDQNAYEFPASQLYEMVASEVTGEVIFSGPEQTVLPAGGEKVLITGGQQIFANSDSVLKVWSDDLEMAKKKMQARELITMPDSFGANLQIAVESGSVSLIEPAKIADNQRLRPGSKIELDTRYNSSGDGNALIKLPNQAYTRVDPGQSLEIRVLEDPTSPYVTLSLANGFYYAIIRSFDLTGFRSLQSESVLLSPNICSDRQDPLPVAGPGERSVAIFKKLKLDASQSFDTFGKVMSYYVDTDLESDSNKDGDKTNDKNLGHDINPVADSDGNGIVFDDLDDPVFILGPYKDLNSRRIMLNVVDESGNIGQQEININIYVPKITLDEQSAILEINEKGEGSTVSGYLTPAESEMPVSILRDRAGVKDPIITDAADAFGKYITDAEGKFAINDLNLKDTVVIKNAQGEVIAEIDPKTGRIILKNPAYSVEALPAEEPLLPTRVVVKDPQGKIIATLFVVSDANTDVVVDGPEENYSGPAVALFTGVHIKNLLAAAPDFEIKNIPGDAEKYAGGIEIVEKSSLKRVAVLDPGGNFYVYDPRLSLVLKTAADLSEPMIFQVVLQKAGGNKTVIAEFYVAFNAQKPITILDPDKFKLFVGTPEAKGPKFDTDKDGMPDIWEQQFGLNISDAADAAEDLDKDGLTNLEEYLAGTNPLLADADGDGFSDSFEKIFGTDPNSKATSPFSDVDKNNPYYQSILNFFQRGILKGIPAGNQLKFGLQEPIKRSEYAKVMLDTFCIVPRPEAKTGPAVFTDIPYTEGQALPWYFAATKEAYFQGFITGYRGLIDKRSGQTPFAPDATISKAEAVKIILEALERQKLISLKEIPLTEPYYLPYLQIAQNLSPYVNAGVNLKNNFILTAEEAKNPEADLNRGEFIKLADRVLSAYDCSLIDTDGDGMPDFWEKQHDLNHLDAGDADDDPDKDRLKNLDEYKFGTDPWLGDTDKGGVWDGVEVLDRHTNPLDPSDDYLDTDGDGLSDADEINKYQTKPGEKDTDGGGVTDGDEVLKNGTNPLSAFDDRDTDGDGLGDKEETDLYKTDPLNPDTDEGGIKDGVEVKRGTDPLNPEDDLIDPRKDLGEGVYVIPEPCASCPCPSAIDHTADLIPGDRIIGVISNNNNSSIFSQSNLIEIAEIKEFSP